MQKQLKLIDQQLNKNGLLRICDPITKTQNSYFRALAMSIFYNHSQWQKIKSYLKLCLIFNCELSQHNNPFPKIPNRNRYLKKFRQNHQLLLDYLNNPDLNCFFKENLQLVSLTFDCKLSVFTINSTDQNQYLQQTIVSLGSSCTQKSLKLKNIMICKIGNRYYCVFEQYKSKMITFIKQYILGQILNNLLNGKNSSNSINGSSCGKQGKIHFPNFDENHSRQHKKSLSDCGDLVSFNEQLGLNLQNLTLAKRFTYQYQASQGGQGYHQMHQSPVSGMNGYMEEMDYYFSLEQPLVQNNPQQFDFQQQKLPYSDFSLMNNGRYSGRLKFFDQSRNYGFIVVDSINEDLFVHFDDLSKAGICKDNLRGNVEMRFQFTCLQYDGKYKKSKKAVDLVLIS